MLPSGEGPIPARAGEPNSNQCVFSVDGAYPRSRGGTLVIEQKYLIGKGLSPLARGNRCSMSAFIIPVRPIPARAGEPKKDFLHCYFPRAYPRSRGGTLWTKSGSDQASGLSPLARGNHVIDADLGHRQGPIPARAGEPQVPWTGGQEFRAYPRSRGGTCGDDVY